MTSDPDRPCGRITEAVPEVLAGDRLDRFVALRGSMTRAEAAAVVASGSVTVNDRPVTRTSRKLVSGDVVSFPEPDRPVTDAGPQPDPTVAFDVVYEDADLLVVDKPPGLVVHAGAGHPDGTLVNGLLARYPDIAGVVDARDPDGARRPGIVHRLDGGTSGLLVVARNQATRAALVEALAERDVGRGYVALVEGHLASSAGMVDAPIGRSERDATRQAVTVDGRPAVTHYEVRARFDRPARLSLVDCELETGRTHQIRVHLAAIGHPVCGDGRYGATARLTEELGLRRPFLHARRLHLVHPGSGEELQFEAPLPADLVEVLTRVEPPLDQAGPEPG